jgi:hypothetical protein
MLVRPWRAATTRRPDPWRAATNRWTQRSESCSAATPAPTMPRVTLALPQLRQAPRPVTIRPFQRSPVPADDAVGAAADRARCIRPGQLIAFARPSAASTPPVGAPSRRAKGQQQLPTGTGPWPFGGARLIRGAQHVRAEARLLAWRHYFYAHFRWKDEAREVRRAGRPRASESDARAQPLRQKKAMRRKYRRSRGAHWHSGRRRRDRCRPGGFPFRL